MKKKNNILMIVAVLIILVGGIWIFATGKLGATTDVPLASGSYIKGEYNLVPTYGRIQCQQGQNAVYYPTDFISYNQYKYFDRLNLRCNDFGTLLQSCDVVFKTPTVDKISKMYATLLWSVCDTSQSSCSIGGTAAISKCVRGCSTNTFGIPVPYVYNYANIDKVFTQSLSENQYLVAQYNEADLLTALTGASAAVNNKASYHISAKPFFLYRYDIFSLTSGQAIPGTEDCTNAKTIGEANLLITGVGGGGALEQQIKVSPTLNVDTAMRARDAVFYYVSNFVAAQPQYDMFDDGMKYCVDKKVYAVETITTKGGTYRVATTSTNKVLKTVECCNAGDAIAAKGTGYYCNSNFEVVPLAGSEGQACVNGLCPILGYVSVGNTKVAYQECNSGICSAPLYKTVECTNAFACPGGYCDVDPLNPSNNKCKSIIPTNSCGNRACEFSRGETPASCPADCHDGGGSDNSFIWWIIGALAVIIIIMLVVMLSRRGGNRTTF